MTNVVPKSNASSLEIVEEATHLLRMTWASTLGAYYLGTVPFLLVFLYFWADMSRNPFAGLHVAEAALGTAAVFVWMKYCQALFAWRVRAHVMGRAADGWSLRQAARVLFVQTVIQPSGLFIIPLSSVLILPFGWVYAFYQNVTALADVESSDPYASAKRAWKQAMLWPAQNHIIIAVCIFFGLGVLLNWVVVGFSMPALLKMFFDIETAASQSPDALFNTTFFAVMFGLTYLCVDPIVKTIYVLRCFYGESLRSGEDLKVGLKQFAASLCIGVLFFQVGDQAVAQGLQTPAPPAVSSAELDRQIDQVIGQSKYVWRMPRNTVVPPEAEKGILARFFAQVVDLLKDAIRTVLEWMDAALRRLFRTDRASRDTGFGGGATSALLLYLLFALLAGLLGFLAIRAWRGRTQPIPGIAETIPRALDVEDEGLSADQLPEDGWTELARRLLERGEFRLALRAFYLSSLANLAHRNLISIARFKSNRDYQSELHRRAHSMPELLLLFGDNVSVFERTWYGTHDVNAEMVGEFVSNVDRMRAAV